MLKIIEERKEAQKDRIKIAVSYLERLSLHLGKITAVLYGSTVRGDFKDWSDMDIVVISDNLPADPMERLDILYESSEGLIEPKGFTVEELKTLINKPFGKLLILEGIVIRDDFNLFVKKA